MRIRGTAKNLRSSCSVTDTFSSRCSGCKIDNDLRSALEYSVSKVRNFIVFQSNVYNITALAFRENSQTIRCTLPALVN